MSTVAQFALVPRGSGTQICPLLEHMPVGLARCELHGAITAFNSRLEQMLGSNSNLAEAVRFADLVHAQQRDECLRLFREVVERRRDSFQIDSRTTDSRTDGTRSNDKNSRLLRWTAWRVRGTGGEADYALVAAQPAEPDNEFARRLQQAERLETVGRLAGGIAHDFNNLLTGILLYCDLLIAGLEPGHRGRKYAEEIRNAGMQASGLVRQLLATARPASSEPRLVSLNQMAEGMRNLLHRLVGENMELRFQLDPNLGLVKMDPAQSQQILLNLVLNARDAMPDGGHINVETRNCRLQVLGEASVGVSSPTSLPCILFEVADNGSGMDAAAQSHLFEAFFTTKALKGTGLGLATVYDIVTRSGGLIHVESTPASGTRVSILLPLVPQQPVAFPRDIADLPLDHDPRQRQEGKK